MSVVVRPTVEERRARGKAARKRGLMTDHVYALLTTIEDQSASIASPTHWSFDIARGVAVDLASKTRTKCFTQ